MPALSEEDRLRLENEALQRILQGFASLPLESEIYRSGSVQRLVQKSRNILQQVAARKKRLPKVGNIEYQSTCIMDDAIHRGFDDPCLVLERVRGVGWEAYIDEHDEDLGVGEGKTAYEALLDLRVLVRRVRVL